MVESLTRTRRRRGWIWLGAVLCVVVLAVWLWPRNQSGRSGPGPGGAGGPTPVSVASAEPGRIERTLRGLGTVTPVSTVTIRSRVDGPLKALHFTDGQAVRAGDLLAEIDPRPFEIALQQAQGQQAQHMAQLDNARLDLARYETLYKQNSVARQQLDAARAQVRELQGQIQVDQAAVANARLQLGYTRIVAPGDGRLGLHKVDVGNMVHAADTDGLVVLTQNQPMDVVFSIPQGQLPALLAARRQEPALQTRLTLVAGGRVVATGALLAVDNQIDVTTGTVQLKARFANADESLFPNQFVQVSLRLGLESGVVVPLRAVQRSSAGEFVYRVDAQHKAHVVKVTTGVDDGDRVVVESGLQAGDSVVIEGMDRLRDGSSVELVPAGSGAGDSAGAAASAAAPATSGAAGRAAGAKGS
ncbi:MAG TPA: MdtA/MuxA family multidrug efflux RND transporter periplasmic adaptor subunit [Castellaniella sp.]|nr:MdtA/MuxA family multidrug efflux RND transporter periplasmic adaptor subunit [Castellaniella sp.]